MSRILAPAAAIVVVLQGCSVDVPDTARAQTMRVFPDTSIHIDGYLEIDDVDGTGQLPGDADLCADGVDGLPVCPVAGSPADNPNFPGPDPLAPDVLGTGYIDWADLPVSHVLRDDPQVDDAFVSGICIEDGDPPRRADIANLAIAANHTWLYLAAQRTNPYGPDAWHWVFTQQEPYKTRVHGCLWDTWVWDLSDGDVKVTMTFPNRPRTANGTVRVERWTGAVPELQLDAAAMHTHALWQEVVVGPSLQAAYAAYNQGAPAIHGADDEFAGNGDVLTSAVLGEAAVDIAATFGGGCALDRVLTVFTTAPGLGRGDVPRDFLGPVRVACSGLSAEVSVVPTCAAEVDYEVVVWDQRPVPPVVVPLPHPDLAVDVTVDCGIGPVTVRDDDGRASDLTYGPPGPIPVAVMDPTNCDVSAVATGIGSFGACVGGGATSAVVAPVLEAQADLTGSCVAVWTYLGQAHGGAPPFTYSWEFTRDGVPTWISPSPEGFGPMGGGTDPVTIGGDLEITDARGCSAGAYDEAVVHHPDGGTCP